MNGPAEPAPLSDALARFIFEGAAVRGAVVSLDRTLRDILATHPYPPALARALAEFAAAAALLASTLKFKGSLIVQLASEGPVRLAVVECDAELSLRATAQWRDEAASLPADATLAVLAGDLARARLVITLDPKDGGPVYQGIVAIAGGSIAGLIEHYLATSEQIDSRMRLAAIDGGVRGLLVQRLPGAGPEDDDAWQRTAAAIGALDLERLAHTATTAELVGCRVAGARRPAVRRAGDPLRLPLLGGAGRAGTAAPRPRRDRGDPGRTRGRRGHLRILQPALHAGSRRGARTVRRRPAGGRAGRVIPLRR